MPAGHLVVHHWRGSLLGVLAVRVLSDCIYIFYVLVIVFIKVMVAVAHVVGHVVAIALASRSPELVGALVCLPGVGPTIVVAVEVFAAVLVDHVIDLIVLPGADVVILRKAVELRWVL